jgi:phage tail-like protein
MSNEVAVDPAVSLYFKVTIDGKDIGAFIGCDGLSMEVHLEPVKEGGNNGFTWQLPGRITYTNIKLTRPVGPDSKLLAEWIASMTGPFKRPTARISALTPKGEVLCSWVLDGVIPVKWQGPSFSAESGKVAQETLELAHHGFKYEDGNKWA